MAYMFGQYGPRTGFGEPEPLGWPMGMYGLGQVATPFDVIGGFAFDRSDLGPPQHTRIIALAQRILASAIRAVRVVGHTDPVGPPDYNRALGQRRADAVRRALLATLDRLRPGAARAVTVAVETAGETQIVARGPSEPERARNRRVEVFVGPGQPVSGCAPFRERVRLHLKILVPPTRFTIDQMLQSMQQVYRAAGIRVEVASREQLRLPLLEAVDIFCPGNVNQTCCPFPCATNTLNAEYVALFQNRNNVRPNELAVYFVRQTIPGLNGCCAHPLGRPGVIVTARASQWTLGHEVGHVLGLPHVNNNDRLMTGGGTNNITNPPPDLVPSEIQTMLQSALTTPC